MVRYYTSVIVLLQFILVLASSSPTNGRESLSMDDRLQQENITQDFAIRLEELELNMTRLAELELKVEGLKETIVALQQKIDRKPSAVSDHLKSGSITSAESDTTPSKKKRSFEPNDGVPTSCMDLKNLGYFYNGMYMVMGPDLEGVPIYCDFGEISSVPSFPSLNLDWGTGIMDP